MTATDIAYEGSIAIDPVLLDRAKILPFEQVQVYNITTGQRFTTYAIEAEQSGRAEICVNGAAARLAEPGDEIIIACYAEFEPAELEQGYRPTVILLDAKNRPAAD